MYGVSPQAYDRAITVFSPDGRLFQVEYAKEAVKRGSTALGIATDKGVVLIATKLIYSKLIYQETLKKIFKVDNHIYATASGLIADIRRLIGFARQEARRFKLLYETPSTLTYIVGKLVDVMQLYTQYGGARPFGASLLVTGKSNAEEKFVVYEIEPSGAYTGYKAVAIGEHRKEVNDYLEKHYNGNLDINKTIKLGLKALRGVYKNESSLVYEIAYLALNSDSFVRLNEKEVSSFIKKL